MIGSDILDWKECLLQKRQADDKKDKKLMSLVASLSVLVMELVASLASVAELMVLIIVLVVLIYVLKKLFPCLLFSGQTFLPGVINQEYLTCLNKAYSWTCSVWTFKQIVGPGKCFESQ